jgi:hypothetical protein
MQFMFQWQFKPQQRAGLGIAWIDADGDAIADRVYGFTATLHEHELRLGPVERLETSVRPLSVRSP